MVFWWEGMMFYINYGFSFQDTVSVHRPGFYAHRFLDFMADKVFKKIPSREYSWSLSNFPEPIQFFPRSLRQRNSFQLEN